MKETRDFIEYLFEFGDKYEVFTKEEMLAALTNYKKSLVEAPDEIQSVIENLG